MLNLKGVLRQIGKKQSDLATHLNVSQATVAQIVNHGQWPESLDTLDLQESILDYLEANGANEQQLGGVFEEVSEPPVLADAAARSSQSKVESNQEEAMLLRKQTLNQGTRRHFGIFSDPFADDAVQSVEDMYASPDIRYVKEAIWQTAKNGGLLAVVGESGAGKTTLLRELEDRIVRESQPILIVKPYVLAMEDNDQRGKTLKSTHIAEALMAAVAPLEKPKSSPEARFAQLHKALKSSHEAGYRHCLVIDEAHALPIPTIKHLKRFFELELGFKKLLSIILIGQPELKVKLSERDAAVREVVQRCEMVELTPLEGGRLDEYLKFKLERKGKKLDEVIDQSGVDALRSRLTINANRQTGGRPEVVNLLYPLALGNLLTGAMNLAADLGVPVVTADVVKGV